MTSSLNPLEANFSAYDEPDHLFRSPSQILDWLQKAMRFNKQEMFSFAKQPSQNFDKEGVLLLKERQDGFFKRTESEFRPSKIYKTCILILFTIATLNVISLIGMK